MRLSIKLPLFFILFSLITVFIISYISYDNSKTAIENEVQERLLAINLLKEAEIERWLNDSERIIELLAENVYFKDELSGVIASHDTSNPMHVLIHKKVVEDILINGIGDIFFEIFILRLDDGLVLISTDENQEGKILADQPYFINGKNNTFIQTVYYSISIQQPAMTVSTPVKDRQGSSIAVLAGRLNLNDLSSIMEKHSGNSQTEDTYLVNKFNFFITEPRFGKDYALKKTAHTDGVKAALKQNDGIGFYNNYQGIPVIGAYNWIDEREICILTEMHQSEAFAPVYKLQKRAGFTGIGIILFSSVIGWLLSLTITKPVNRLVYATRRIGSGDLDYKFNIKGKDEISRLANEFKGMTKELKKTLVSRDELSAEISVRKKAEEKAMIANSELTAANKELEAFSYSVSHDLRAPLRHIIGFIELLQKHTQKSFDEKSQRYLGIIRDSAARMGNLIDDLLTFSRIGRYDMKKSNTDISRTVSDVIREFDGEIKKREIKFKVEKLPAVYCDTSLIQLVFSNLISNAVKFTRNCKKPEIEISFSESDGEFVFSVSDNGVGFDMNYADKLFGVFQRLHNQEEFEGTGVGLANVHRIISRHGGRTWAEGKINKGAKFYFSLPKKNSL